MKLFIAVFALLAAFHTSVWAQQEIELELETPPAVSSPEGETPEPVLKPESGAGSVKLPSRIEAIVRGKGPAITGESAILVDAETGQMLFERNAFVKRPIASTTKIMTAIVAMERCKMDDIVVASKYACTIPHTSLNLKPGERIPMLDILTGLLLRSANDAAVAVAEHVAGSVPAFARLMNAKAKEIGAKNTNFKNPNGLYVSGHYSTAYDLALITRYALQIPEINKILSQRKAYINRSLNQEDLVVFQKSTFMKHYTGADGVKSGYTRESGNCFVGSATRKGWRLISVVLKSKNANKDTATLMDYGFSNFRRVVVTPKGKVYRSGGITGTGSVPAVNQNALCAAIPVSGNAEGISVKPVFRKLSIPIKRGETLGSLLAYMDDVPVGEVKLVATRDVVHTAAGAFWYWIRNCLLALVCMGMVVKYGGAAAKGSFRSRRRVAAEIRRINRLR